jgi:hypothetical protein
MIFYVLIARDLKCRSLICRPVRVGVVEMDFSATLSGLEIIEKVYVPRKTIAENETKRLSDSSHHFRLIDRTTPLEFFASN